MATKIEIIDYVRGIVDPSGVNPRFHPRIVESAIEKICNQVARNIPEELLDSYDFYCKEYTNQTVTKDTVTNRFYTLLPAPVIPLSIVSESVRHINSNQGTDLDFVPMRETDWEIYDGLFSDDTDTTIGYIVRYNRILYDKRMTQAVANGKVRLVLAVTFSAFDDEEHVALPGGDYDMMNAVVSQLLTSQPLNLKNDVK